MTDSKLSFLLDFARLRVTIFERGVELIETM